jgi:hypothetical protein
MADQRTKGTIHEHPQESTHQRHNLHSKNHGLMNPLRLPVHALLLRLV